MFQMKPRFCGRSKGASRCIARMSFCAARIWGAPSSNEALHKKPTLKPEAATEKLKTHSSAADQFDRTDVAAPVFLAQVYGIAPPNERTRLLTQLM